MIPVRLELKNFMSYGDDVPPLDFTGMHTLCLSGDNGNGKSALLDAITWSLWGESRAGKNRHDDLVRIGADEMSVQFTFSMDGCIYRVMRKRSKRAGGNQWELQQEIRGGGWRSLTGNNAGETEKAIQKLLRMSYDTFLNSAYLRQGQADQFVKQPAGKRKEILADILDLSRYDRLEQKARERARDAGLDATDIEREINQIDAELASEDTLRKELADATVKVVALQERQAAVKCELDEINKQIGQLEGRKSYADQLDQRAKQLDLEIADLEARIAGHIKEVHRWEALLGERAVIEKSFAELVTAREALTILDVDLRKYHRGRTMVAETEGQYAVLANNARREVEIATAELRTAETKLADLPRLRKQHAEVAGRLAKADEAIAKRQALDAEHQSVQARLRKLENESVALNQQITAWEGRLSALAAQEGTCLVCNAPLPPERAESVHAEYEAERVARIDVRKRVWADAKAAKLELAGIDQQIRSLDAAIAGGLEDRMLFGQFEQRLKEFDQLLASLPSLKQKLTEATTLVDQESFAPDLKKKLENFRAHLQKLEYVPVQHAEVRRKIADLEPMERKHLELAHAKEALADAESRRMSDEQVSAARQVARTELEKQRSEFSDVATQLAALNVTCASKQAQIGALQTEERAIALEMGRRQSGLDRCEMIRGERVGKQQRLLVARKDQEAYDQLAKAFGKKGVQALIIENAIPEIIEETNRLLERLTDGDMSVYFDTLRESRSRRDSPIETLDIKVSDSLGTRPLEMYSGGESFRAAFALRIALSKLLARRAGAKLQTLIIDEGFGTQDGKGREKLVDALNAIKEDFEKIIVITHIDELKDAFATRIEITKTPLGSQITVMEGDNG